jgi:hypothetical protein
MNFNRNTLVVHRIFFSRPRAVFDWVDRAGSLGSPEKNRAFVPKIKGRFVQPGNGEHLVSHR